MAFLDAKNERLCRKCDKLYTCIPPQVLCPYCSEKGTRQFDRLTIIAGRRFGKTKIGSIAGAQEASIPNSVGWACAPSDPKLMRYVIPAFQELIPKSWVQSWNAEYKDLRLKNGALIHFQTLEDPDQGRGQGLDWLYIDEVCELTKRHWEVIRPSLAGDTVAFFTTSPQGYDWVYEELFHPAEEGLPGYWACHAKTSESANPKVSADFLAREKAQMSDTMFRQEYEADFVIFTGAVYGTQLEEQIVRSDDVIKRMIPEWPQIAPWRPVIVGIDTGADHPFGALKLVSTEKGLVVVGEYLDRDKTFVQHANAIRHLAYSPTAKFAINKNERQPMLELAQHGIICQASENDIVAGTERVKSWLQAKQLWFVEAACPNTFKQMRAYRWAKNEGKDNQKRKEKVFKLNDELPDCLRYALMTWPVLPQPVVLTDQPRDISNLPEKMQQDIQRMRKVEKVEKLKPQEVTGDFWG
jgi:hypothetical protein